MKNSKGERGRCIEVGLLTVEAKVAHDKLDPF